MSPAPTVSFVRPEGYETDPQFKVLIDGKQAGTAVECTLQATRRWKYYRLGDFTGAAFVAHTLNDLNDKVLELYGLGKES